MSVPAARRASSCSARAGMIASSSGPDSPELRLLHRQPVGVGGGHREPAPLELHEDSREHRPRLVARGSACDLLDRAEKRRRFDRVELHIDAREAREVFRAEHVDLGRVAAGLDLEHSVGRLVRERHAVVREELHQVGEQPAGNDDSPVALDVAGDGSAERDLHVRRGESQLAVLGLEQDPGQNLHRAARGKTSRDNAERSCELVARAGHLECGGRSYVCVHYLLKKASRSRRSVHDGEDA